MQRLSVNLWFEKEAMEAVDFYISIFKNSRIIRITHYGKEGQEIHKMPDGMIMTVEFELDGLRFVALNGGPLFKFTEAVSIIVNCQNQEEVDHYWEKLTNGGNRLAQQCGWLKDKYGVSWQVVPTMLPDLIHKEDGEKERPVMKVMMDMKKIDIKKLEEVTRKDNA